MMLAYKIVIVCKKYIYYYYIIFLAEISKGSVCSFYNINLPKLNLHTAKLQLKKKID